MLEGITPLILTLNEAPNIERTLARLDWAPRVVIVDSGSTDGTVELARTHPNTEVFVHAFDSHAAQWNYGLDATGIDTPWVLALDADYVLTEDLVGELRSLQPPDDVTAWRAAFRYCVDGKPLRCGTYPPVAVLFRRGRARYVQEGHTQRLVPEGRVGELRSRILHDDRKPLADWLASQRRYAVLEADHLTSSPVGSLTFADRLRTMMWPAPPLMFAYVYFARLGILDGWRGLFYAWQRTYAEVLLALELLHRKLARRETPP